MKRPALAADVKGAFIAAMVLAFGASAIDNGALGWMVTPFVLALSFYAMAKAPIRSSALVVIFLALTLENPSERPTFGMWVSPWSSLGALMLMHLKNTVGGGLFFSGMDVVLAWLGLVALFRANTGSKIDRIGNVKTPRPLIQLAQVSLLTMGLAFAVGAIRGGSDSAATLWQMDRVMYVPLLFLLFQIGFRGREDTRALAKVLLIAAVERACEAMYVRYSFFLPPDPETGELGIPYTTTHGDSMLFAAASVLLAALVIQRVPRTKWIVLTVAPILAGGMLANNRRMVWLQIILVMITVYFSTDPNPMKRKIQRIVKFSLPLVVAYGFIGWGSKNPVFKPVNVIRSAVDSETDSSTLWRDIENYDLVFTIRQYPFFGSGYGRPFIEAVGLPQVDYPLERFLPHDAVLGLWAFYGYAGFVGITSLWVAGVYFAMLAYRRLPDPEGKAAALVCFGSIQIYYVQCYGDLGLGTGTGVYILAPALAIAAKLAVSTGAWPHKASVVGAARIG